MKEIVIISGKGGTGKTSITSSFASLAKNTVLADCDVDAADLHLILDPEIKTANDFISGNLAVINRDNCLGCEVCLDVCKFDAIKRDDDGSFTIDAASCEGCGVCVEFCPTSTIEFPQRHCGQWFESQTRYGTMIHAKLGIAAENSGRLVSMVRQEAKRVAEKQNADLIIVDGPPGTGCPVIASITGADAVVAVTEPTLSGLHDLKRIIKLTAHFGIRTFVCVNKWDINPHNTAEIERFVESSGCQFIGKIPYSKEVTKAQIEGRSVVESGSEEIKTQITTIWENLNSRLLEG